jgi:hypothetical protein
VIDFAGDEGRKDCREYVSNKHVTDKLVAQDSRELETKVSF